MAEPAGSERVAEQVWGLPRDLLFGFFEPFQGFRAASVTEDLTSVGRALKGAGEFRLRSGCEEDPAFKQIIPYVVIRVGDELLVNERLARQSESRLHNRLSLGIGGHVNPEPPGPGTLLERGLDRELREELVLDETALTPRLLGFINDDSTPVGSVHFGIACELRLPERVAIREVQHMTGSWRRPAELWDQRERFESWSRLLLESDSYSTLSC